MIKKPVRDVALLLVKALVIIQAWNVMTFFNEPVVVSLSIHWFVSFLKFIVLMKKETNFVDNKHII